MKIRKFNENSDYSEYHPISNEDIEDLVLEMTDDNFDTNIRKYFINENGSKTTQPISEKSYPIYDICISKDTQDYNLCQLDGSYYYDDIGTLKMFTSVLNKMKNLLSVKEAYYTIINEKYNIRLVLNEISMSESDIGFDINQFSDKFYKMIGDMDGVEVLDYGHGGSSIYLDLFSEGPYKEDDYKMEKWKTSDDINNKDVYKEIVESLVNYIKKYKKFITYGYDTDQEYEENRGVRREVKIGFLRKKTQTYIRYKLGFRIKLKK